MFQFARGHILEINTINGQDFAKVTISGNITIDNVLIVYPHNTASKPKLEDRGIDTNQILQLRSVSGQVYGFPYSVPLQNSSLKAGEYEAGNLKKENKIKFDETGDIIISSPSGTSITIKESGDIELSVSGDINLAAASAAVLNTLAGMTVTVPGGSSAGTYPVTINTSGQTSDQVKA